MDYVHHCPFCSWQRRAASATMLAPHCDRCGGTLRAVSADRAEEARREDADTKSEPKRGGDGTAVFALLAVGPWLLPILGVRVGDLAFLGPLVLCAFAVAALGVSFLIVPGLDRGDVALTLVVVLDLAALVVVALTAVARRASRRHPAAWWLVAACAALVAGDGLVSAAAAGQLPALSSLT